MKMPRYTFRSAVMALCALGVLAPAVQAVSSARSQEQGTMIVAAADCYAIGQRVASQNGGTLARASASTQGGQPVCVIVVLVPGKDGQRPRRAEFVVPQN
ncbi:hypothetical protein [Pseudaminobacter salicylatoxidans]|uniref:hypothetical protein n=1 Tax=Pseudaminobacter salicylatoxidans TaxID=93369 RepID=UPI000474550D|nr:hypothetical protein [Pseudaminobacter salicylatoxidans]